METLFLTFQSASLTFKIHVRSRSSKSDLDSPSSQQCISLSLIKIHPLVQEIPHWNHISDISKYRRDLGSKAKGHRNLINSLPLPTMYLCKLGQNPSLDQKITHGTKNYTDADRIRAKKSMSPPPTHTNIHLYVSGSSIA